MKSRMTTVSAGCDDAVKTTKIGRRSKMEKVRIPGAGVEKIEKAGRIKLSAESVAEIENALNSYILHRSWDENSRPSKETRRHSSLLGKHIDGVLDALGDVNRKLRTEDGEYHPGIALSDQSLFHRAGVSVPEFYDQLLALNKQLEETQMESNQAGRPKDLFLSEFFSELEQIFLNAGGNPVGVTKDPIRGTRESPFTDFVNAILRFAPAGIGPSSSAAVAA